jgi:hypothetical protein
MAQVMLWTTIPIAFFLEQRSKSSFAQVDASYSEKYPSLSIDNIPNNLPSIPQTIYGIKSTDWHYEEEWRMFAVPGDAPQSFEPLALTGIYFGCKMEENHKYEIVKMLHNFPSAKLYEMQRSESEFKVYPKEIFLL